MGLAFRVVPAGVDEDDRGLDGPESMVRANARRKAAAVAAGQADALVLGSDTTVALDARVFSKPACLDEARAMLRALAGREHLVHTAVALRWRAGEVDEVLVETSRVRFHPLDDAAIDGYFALVDPLDKAGAYGIQEGRERIIESVDGSVENVMGLPVQRLGAWLEERGFDFARG
jgi:septum formation protein